MDAPANIAGPSLVAFERLLAERRLDQAAQAALQILESLDAVYGEFAQIDVGPVAEEPDDGERAVIFCTRYAAALGRLLTETEFKFSDFGFEAFLLHHRWIDLIFSISGFRSSDHLLPMLAQGVSPNTWNLSNETIIRILPVLSLNSRYGLDLEQWWRANPAAAAAAFLHFLGSRTVFRPRAFELRERLLEWLPDRLGDVTLGSVSLSRAAEIYMHCSYAFTPKKHAIKAAIIKQMRRQCIEIGCREISPDGAIATGERPTIVVVAEHFSARHSIYRTHSAAVRSLRARFRVVGILPRHHGEGEVASCFDEVVAMPQTDFVAAVRSLVADIASRAPAIMFYLGVGMRADVIALAALRLAPVQCVSFGHTATTMSPVIDYMILPEDFVGSQDCFSEQLLTCPPEAMPFVPIASRTAVWRGPPAERGDALVRIAVAASIMKLNPRFFDALDRIATTSRSEIEFHFFPLAAHGLAHVELADVVRRRLKSGVVHKELPFEAYRERLRQCDLFLCPFPYGNMNSIVDAVSLGLPGVCHDGAEAHAHADAAIFARIGLPRELVAANIDQYVASAVRLIDDGDWRRRCGDISRGCDVDAAFYRGKPDLFCQMMASLLGPRNHGSRTARPSPVPREPP
jgi:hypothetical protein